MEALRAEQLQLFPTDSFAIELEKENAFLQKENALLKAELADRNSRIAHLLRNHVLEVGQHSFSFPDGLEWSLGYA